MGTPALLDSNIVIYFLDNAMSEKAMDYVEKQLNEFGSFISVITLIELLGWQAPTEQAVNQIELFVAETNIIPLSDQVVSKTIELRRSLKIKLPDAIIAATAIVHDFVLIFALLGFFTKQTTFDHQGQGLLPIPVNQFSSSTYF